MLQSNLLVLRRRGDRIKPVFAERTADNLEIAEGIINLFTGCVGGRYSVLGGELQMLEESLTADYRFLRGLYTLLERRVVFGEPARDPLLLRQTVFEMAGKKPVVSGRDRTAVFERASKRLEISQDELEENLWIDEDPVIREFKPITSDELLSLYNLSLLQTLLFKADVLEISLPGPNTPLLRDLLRRLRFYGLMYDIWKAEDRINLVIDGPISVLKRTKKYGVSMAKFIPHVVDTTGWSLKSSIIDDRKIFEFQISEGDFSRYYGSRSSLEGGGKPVFDSAVEEKFYRQFNALNTNWILKREPEPLIRDSAVMFPDFSFEGYSRRFFMEVVGFWTGDYLERKAKKLKLFPELIICVDEGLRCSPRFRLPAGPGNVIFYRKTIPLKKVLNILQGYETEELSREIKIIDNSFRKPTQTIVAVGDLCSELRVSAEAMRRFLQKGVEGYSFTGNLLISNNLMDEISAKLDKLAGKGTYSQALDIIGNFTPAGREEIFDALGYTVDWKSLNVEDAIIKRKN